MSRRALITGASAGLGAEFARQLAAAGNDLVLVARRVDKLEALAAELRDAQGVDVAVIAADMTDPAAPAQLFRQTQERGLQIDYLVNNAGSEGPDLLRTRDWSRHEAYLRLMMTSVAAMCHEFIPGMLERGFGRVINVASVAGPATCVRAIDGVSVGRNNNRNACILQFSKASLTIPTFRVFVF